MVEVAGVEPASEDDQHLVLHAFLIVYSRTQATQQAKHTLVHPVYISFNVRQVRQLNYSMIMTHSKKHGHNLVWGLRLRRRERRCYRWQITVYNLINEVSCDLGMNQKVSLPPSKPWHPHKLIIA